MSLFEAPCPTKGCASLGAWVRDSVDLENAHLAHQWWLDKSRVDAEVRLVSLQTNDLVSFEGSVFAGSIQFIWGAKVNAQLNLSGAKITGTLDMDLLTVGSTLDLSGAKVAGKLNMSGLTVGSHLFMHNQAEFTDVNLTGAKVGNQLSLIGAKVTGTLNMNGIAVGSNLGSDPTKGCASLGPG